MTDNSTSKTVIIQDDSSGNLYAPSASVSASALSLSGSSNYIGNIFYELGVVTITDTGSCLLYTSPSPRDRTRSRMPSSA